MTWLGPIIKERVHDQDMVLDIGCGTLNATDGPIGRIHMGVDCYEPYLDSLKDQIPTLCGKLPYVLNGILPRSWDVVILLDVIEHLSKAEGVATLKRAEAIARKRVAVFTPDGFVENHPIPEDPHGANPAQEHITGWKPSFFENRGYEIRLLRNGNRWAGKFGAFLAWKEIV